MGKSNIFFSHPYAQVLNVLKLVVEEAPEDEVLKTDEKVRKFLTERQKETSNALAMLSMVRDMYYDPFDKISSATVDIKGFKAKANKALK